MKNTVSLHKVWIARTAGLFVLTALAVVYFAIPALTMAAQVKAQNLNVQTLKNATNVKVAFVGPVNAAAPADMTATTGVMNIVRFPKVALSNLAKGEWVAVKVTDTTSNQSYAWTCTIFNISKTTGATQCALGQPANFKLTPQAVINRLQGTLIKLNLTPDATGNVTVKASDLAGSGWGSQASV